MFKIIEMDKLVAEDEHLERMEIHGNQINLFMCVYLANETNNFA